MRRRQVVTGFDRHDTPFAQYLSNPTGNNLRVNRLSCGNMDVSNLLSYDTQVERDGQPEIDQATQEQDHQRSHQYSTRYAILTNGQPVVGQGPVGFPLGQATRDNGQDISTVSSHSPGSIGPKNVAFELLFEGATNYRARLPMRVQIFPHDTTESIVTTVKNFYGLYEGTAKGVSFEDDQGHTLIARYENLKNNMVVYVRVIPDYPQNSQPNSQAGSHSPSPISAQRTSRIDESLQMLPPQPAQALSYGQPLSRPASRVARKRSQSPRVGRSRRSTSVQKARSRSGIKSHEESAHANPEEPNSDAINGYSSSDGGAGSVTSSRKARSEQLASAEISLDNIVEGGRRKRAKFESSVSFVTPMTPMVFWFVLLNFMFRNCRCSFHLKYQLPTRFLPSRPRGDQTGKKMRLRSPDPLSATLPIASLSSPLRATDSTRIQMGMLFRMVRSIQCLWLSTHTAYANE